MVEIMGLITADKLVDGGIVEMTITIPESQWRKIWVKYYPDPEEILGEYLFILTDTYGVGRRSIETLINQISQRKKDGKVVYLRCPKGWKDPEYPNKDVRGVLI